MDPVTSRPRATWLGMSQQSFFVNDCDNGFSPDFFSAAKLLYGTDGLIVLVYILAILGNNSFSVNEILISYWGRMASKKVRDLFFCVTHLLPNFRDALMRFRRTPSNSDWLKIIVVQLQKVPIFAFLLIVQNFLRFQSDTWCLFEIWRDEMIRW